MRRRMGSRSIVIVAARAAQNECLGTAALKPIAALRDELRSSFLSSVYKLVNYKITTVVSPG